jgi:hypothetical protein
MNVSDIRVALLNGVFTAEELNSVADAVKYARSQMGKRVVRSLRVGDAVKFTSPRTGVTFRGTVDKVKVKYVLVATPQGRYNVPANMLEAV